MSETKVRSVQAPTLRVRFSGKAEQPRLADAGRGACVGSGGVWRGRLAAIDKPTDFYSRDLFRSLVGT